MYVIKVSSKLSSSRWITGEIDDKIQTQVRLGTMQRISAAVPMSLSDKNAKLFPKSKAEKLVKDLGHAFGDDGRWEFTAIFRLGL